MPGFIPLWFLFPASYQCRLWEAVGHGCHSHARPSRHSWLLATDSGQHQARQIFGKWNGSWVSLSPFSLVLSLCLSPQPLPLSLSYPTPPPLIPLFPCPCQIKEMESIFMQISALALAQIGTDSLLAQIGTDSLDVHFFMSSICLRISSGLILQDSIPIFMHSSPVGPSWPGWICARKPPG